MVVVGSSVPDGAAVGEWVIATAHGLRAFYDIDTLATLAELSAGDHEHLSPALMPRYDLYLHDLHPASTCGPPLAELAARGVRMPRPLLCAVDPYEYHPVEVATRWQLGHLRGRGADRRDALEELLVEPARRRPDARFVVAGAQRGGARWPDNVERARHVAPPEHPAFYCAQRFTLHLSRAATTPGGCSLDARLLEAAACGVPIITDGWPGMQELLEPGEEILVATTADELLAALRIPDEQRRQVAARARRRVLGEHTAAHRARALERHVVEAARLALEHPFTRAVAERSCVSAWSRSAAS